MTDVLADPGPRHPGEVKQADAAVSQVVRRERRHTGGGASAGERGPEAVNSPMERVRAARAPVPNLSRDDFLKSVHECRPFLGRVGRKVDQSGKAGAGDFYPSRCRGRKIGEVFDRMDLGDGGVVDLSDVGLVEETTFAFARKK